MTAAVVVIVVVAVMTAVIAVIAAVMTAVVAAVMALTIVGDDARAGAGNGSRQRGPADGECREHEHDQCHA